MPDINIPLAATLESRDGDLVKGALLTNCYPEARSDGVYVKRRPGSFAVKIGIGGLNTGMASFVVTNGIFNGRFYWISNNVIYDLNGGTWPLTGDFGNSLDNTYSITNGIPAIPITIKGQFLWTFTGATLTKVTDPDFPAQTTSGVVSLDSTTYVLTTDGFIRGSAINNAASWSALNSIQVDLGIGTPAVIFRHLNYIYALGSTGLQAFYDAANPAPGSPLSPVTTEVSPYGATRSTPPAIYKDTVVWLSPGVRGNAVVVMMEQGKLSVISTPDVERVLFRNAQAADWSSSFSYHLDGATFYGFNHTANGVSLVYHRESGMWMSWNSRAAGVPGPKIAYPFIHVSGEPPLAVSRETGHIVQLSSTTIQDDSIIFPECLIRTAPLDGGTGKRKFLSRLVVAADTSQPNAPIVCRYTDDDYQTWGASRNIPAYTPWKQLTRLGSFRSRAFELDIANLDVGVGVATIELDVEKGSR